MDAKSSRPFAVFDIDGTLIRWQLYHAIVNQLAKHGDISESANHKIHEARMVWKRRDRDESFRDYEMVLVKTYWQSLGSISPSAFYRAVDEVFDEYKDQVFTYTRDLVKKLKAENYLLFAISGSHQEIIDKLASYYGFDAAIGQKHEIKNGHFTGNHTTPMLAKDAELAGLVQKFGASRAGSIAVGDGLGDAKMLEQVENPIVFNPDKNLFKLARERGWKVVIERKNMIYELEPSSGGYILA